MIEITPDAVDNIKEALKPLADALGVGVKELWRILVQQQFTEGVVSSILAFLLFFIIIGCICAFYNCCQTLKERREDQDVTLPVLGIMTFGFFLFFLPFVFADCLTDGIKHILNPEYYAIKEAIDFISEAIHGGCD